MHSSPERIPATPVRVHDAQLTPHARVHEAGAHAHVCRTRTHGRTRARLCAGVFVRKRDERRAVRCPRVMRAAGPLCRAAPHGPAPAAQPAQGGTEGVMRGEERRRRLQREPGRAHCAQVDELFREASLDANGMVNYDQFAKLMLAKARIAA
jgi:hypothetical protein